MGPTNQDVDEELANESMQDVARSLIQVLDYSILVLNHGEESEEVRLFKEQHPNVEADLKCVRSAMLAGRQAE